MSLCHSERFEGRGPSKKASGNRVACLHSMGRASRARNVRTNTRTAEPVPQRAKGGNGTRPEASGNRIACLHSAGRAAGAERANHHIWGCKK